jgi:hypothetical protein
MGNRRFTLADDIGFVQFLHPLAGVPDPDLFSPDGSYFLIQTERGRLDQNRPEDTISLFRTEDIVRFLRASKAASVPGPVWTFSRSTFKEGPIISQIRWLSDSSGFVFLLKTGAGNDQLCLAEIAARRVESLTSANESVTGFDIRDRQHLVYSVRSPIIQESVDAESRASAIAGTGRSLYSLINYRLIAKLYDLSELWAIVDGKRFRVEDRATRQPVYLHSAGESSLALAPDGHFAVTAVAAATIPDAWSTLYPSPPGHAFPQTSNGRQDIRAFDGTRFISQYALVDLRRGKVQTMLEAPLGNAIGWYGFERADWSVDGTQVLLSDTFLPYNNDGGLLADRSNRPCVAVIDLRRNSRSCVEQLKPFDEPSAHLIESARFDHSLEDRVIVTYEVENGSAGRVQAATVYSHSRKGDWVPNEEYLPAGKQTPTISVQQSLNDPPVLVASDKLSQTSRTILNPNPQFKDIELGHASVFVWKDRQGHDWLGGLYKPPDYSDSRRYPLVIQTHGFVPSLFLPSGLIPTAFAARELAAAGILVLQVQDCPASETTEEGPCNVAGYEAAVEKLAAEGKIDPTRVGIVGFSRTCYYVMEALTTSQLHFRAASITDGINGGYLQYITAAADGEDEYLRDAEGLNGGRPFANGLEQWLRHAPEFQMDKVTTPLQVVANGRAGLLFMWEPYAALRYLNKPVDLIVFDQGTHVISNPAQRLVSQGGTVDWFRYWLKGERDPDPAKNAQYDRWDQLRQLQESNERRHASP